MNSPLYTDYVDDAQTERALAETKEVSRGWKLLGWTSVALSGLLVVGSISAYGYTRYISGGIEHFELSEKDRNAVPKLNNSVNILMLGSDTRAGKGNAKYGKSLVNDTARADTTILLHISPGGGAVTGISFPRDLMVDLPACDLPGGGSSPPQKNMINSAFSIGGAACTFKTIQTLTNIHIDHMAVVDFSGFKGVVNALGGIEICLPKAVNDPKSKLNLSKGKHLVRGEEALAYVRARHGLGDGSDLDRIKRQQKFLNSVATKALNKNYLADPMQLTSVLRSVTKTIKLDRGFGVTEIAKLGLQMKDINVKNIKFVTTPWQPYVLDKNRVQFAQPAADQLFSAVANDSKIVEAAKAPAKTVPVAQIKVRVLNGTGITGKAATVAAELKAKGYPNPTAGNPKTVPDQTVITYGEGAEDAARTLAKLVPGAKVEPSADTPAGVVDLVMAKGWAGLNTSSSLPKKLDGEVKATDPVCNGM
ncbi:hypothetical protein GCM10027589_10300 [Actinocorallia lasiicapitis]